MLAYRNKKSTIFPQPRTDVLLNVFLAIAVDNLANAQQLSQDEEAEETEREERKKNILDQYRERGSPGNSAG